MTLAAITLAGTDGRPARIALAALVLLAALAVGGLRRLLALAALGAVALYLTSPPRTEHHLWHHREAPAKTTHSR